MKKENSIKKQNNNTIPDIDIIDLEKSDLSGNGMDQMPDTDDTSFEEEPFEEGYEQEKVKSGFLSHINMHWILLAVVVIFFIAMIYKFMNWGVRVDLAEIFKDGQGTYEDNFDDILPLIGGTEEGPIDDGVTTIVAFGNYPFSDDRGMEDNLCSLIAAKSGSTVYNCSVSGSYMAAQHPFFSADDAPMDAYTFYWLCTLATGGPIEHYYTSAKEALGTSTPAEADEVVNMLQTIDFNTVDVITVMYDATDYLLGHQMYSDSNNTDIEQFTGNLEAGIELLQSVYPNIRIIVMSPTYAFALNEDGEYVSSDMYTYGQDVLSTYVIKEYGSVANHSVSFVDHLYGTITEDNAKEYLTDHLHLNLKGRELVAQRFVDALNYYND